MIPHTVPNQQPSPDDDVASIDEPPSVHEGIPTGKIYHPLAFPVLALLAPASLFGVLVRIGLQALATYNGQSIFSLAYAQALGCFIMGFCLQLKEPIGNYYGPMYTAVGTGFCGSLTTFSGWELDVFNSWLNADRNSRAGLRDFMDGLGKTVFTLTLALGSFTFGSKLATVALRHFRFPGTPSRTTRYFMTAISVLIWAATFPTYFRLPPSYRHQATAALLFAYPGTLTRYLLSIRLNPALKSFPLGTFAANMLGTALLATFHVLQNLGAPRSSNACALLQGLADGYCGCLTTVSTFAAEVASLRFSKSVGYVLVSWGVGQLILLVILGPSFWAGNVSEQRTCIFP